MANSDTRDESICDCLSENRPSLTLPIFRKSLNCNFNFKKPALPRHWIGLLSIRELTLLAFAQLTWQLDNGRFLLVFDDFFMEFINIGPVYRKGWVGGAWGWGGWWPRLEKHNDTMVEFKMGMTSTCTHKRSTFSPQGLDRHMLTVGVISGSHCQIGDLHWSHFTSCGFTWLERITVEKQTSRH